MSRKTSWEAKRRDSDETSGMGWRSSFEHSKARYWTGLANSRAKDKQIIRWKNQKLWMPGKDGDENFSRILGATLPPVKDQKFWKKIILFSSYHHLVAYHLFASRSPSCPGRYFLRMCILQASKLDLLRPTSILWSDAKSNYILWDFYMMENLR